MLGSWHVSELGVDKLCWHNFEHNRCLKASGIMPSIIGEFSSIILFS